MRQPHQISDSLGAFLGECQAFLEAMATKDNRQAFTPLEVMLFGTYMSQLQALLNRQREAVENVSRPAG
jgi:hypothetical protein